jgi:hypothetical protein
VLTTNKIHPLFTRVIDDLILNSRNDKKLAETIRWIDMQSQKNGISFYEMAFIITDKQMTKKRAQEWLKTKEISGSEN